MIYEKESDIINWSEECHYIDTYSGDGEFNTIIRALKTVEKMKKDVAELEVKRKSAYYPSKMRGNLYQRIKHLKKYYEEK